MIKIFFPILLSIAISLQAQVKNPYANLNDHERLTAITNYLVQKEFDAIKPVVLKKPTPPKIEPAANLVKGKFETTADFEKRIEIEKQKREAYILKLENAYMQAVLEYNRQNKEQTQRYNEKIETLKKNLDAITIQAMSEAYNMVYGTPKLEAIDYDADNELFYGNLLSSKGNFSKKVAIKVPLNMAKAFYDASKEPKVIFNYQDNQVFLKDIKVPFKGENYLAMLTDSDFKSSEIKVALQSRDLNLKEAELLSSNFQADKKAFNIGQINYGKSKIAQLSSSDLQALNSERQKHLQQSSENLASLLQNAKASKKNPKAYAVIFGIEDYMLEPNVNYSQNSAMMFMQYANKVLGVPDEHIWAFVGNKTTSGFIKSQWSDFLSLIEKDATVYFYYSGHGVPGNDGEAYILPSDTNAQTATSDTTFMLKNLYHNLSNSDAKKVIAFIDSCFSGKDDEGKLLFKGVAPVLKSKKINFDESKMTIFTAGSSSDFSNQYKEKKERLFSYYLMKGMALGKTDAKELYTYVRSNVANQSRKLGAAYSQIPQVMGNTQTSIK
jgi:hypothetical protein